jgi:hypothetical protein
VDQLICLTFTCSNSACRLNADWPTCHQPPQATSLLQSHSQPTASTIARLSLTSYAPPTMESTDLAATEAVAPGRACHLFRLPQELRDLIYDELLLGITKLGHWGCNLNPNRYSEHYNAAHFLLHNEGPLSISLSANSSLKRYATAQAMVTH